MEKINEQQEKQLRELLEKYKEARSEKLENIGIIKYKIRTNNIYLI